MAAVAFDALDYAHRLEAAGMPRQQAEVVAKGLTTMFVHNFDALATKDYLDSRFSEFEIRVDANMDKRFSMVDKQFTEIRTEMVGFRGEIRAEMAGLRGDMRGEIGEIRGALKLQSWISAVLVAGIFIPLLQKLVV